MDPAEPAGESAELSAGLRPGRQGVSMGRGAGRGTETQPAGGDGQGGPRGAAPLSGVIFHLGRLIFVPGEDNE